MEEAKTKEFDDEIKLTPFNMKDEMDEGDFDKDGYYHWKKDKDEIKDAWLDNIDWANINSFKKSDRLTTEKKQSEKKNEEGEDDDEEEDDDEKEEDDDENEEEDETKGDQTEMFKQIQAYMKPGENILKTIKRLGESSKSSTDGGSKSTAGLSASERWLKKKKTDSAAQDRGQQDPERAKADKEALEKLTGICNHFISRGFYDIYQETYDSIQSKIESSNKPANTAAQSESFDIFADEINEKDLTASNPSTSGAQQDILEGIKMNNFYIDY